MTDLRTAAQQALEALENCGGLTKDDAIQRVAAIIALKAALAEPVEPVQEPSKFLDVVTYTGKGAVADTDGVAQEPDSPERRCGGPGCDMTCCQPVQEPVAGRAAFERHAERLGYSVDPDTREGREGGYWSSHTQLMWLTWQAAMAQRSAQPVQEPDDGVCDGLRGGLCIHQDPSQCKPERDCPAFSAPPQRKPLTEDAMQKVFTDSFGLCPEPGGFLFRVGRAVERAHKIGGEE